MKKEERRGPRKKERRKRPKKGCVLCLDPSARHPSSHGRHASRGKQKIDKQEGGKERKDTQTNVFPLSEKRLAPAAFHSASSFSL
jgi:hypothetical protein